MHQDPARTLQAVAILGYSEVELVGCYGLEPGALRAILKAAPLSCKSVHIRPLGPSKVLPGLAKDPDVHYQRCRELGVRYLVCPGPWFPHTIAQRLPTENLGLPDIVAAVEQMTIDDWRQSADLINRFAAKARGYGLQLLYHNSNLEFVRCGTGIGFDTLLQHFDPHLVKLELNCGWILSAGQDPLRYLKNCTGRVPLIHIKDMMVTPANHRMLLNPAQIGEG